MAKYVYFIDDTGKQNTFEISGNQLLKRDYGANALTVYSYNKNVENATDISIDKTALSMKIGEKSQIKASAIGTTSTSKTLKWTSSNHEVAVVDEDGVISGRGNGICTISVSNRSGNIKKTISVSINTNLSVVSDFDSILKDEKCITFDDKIIASLDYTKILLKDKDGKILPISTRIDNRKLFIKINSEYIGTATLLIPKNAVNNNVNKGLISDKNLEVFINSYDITDPITLGSKDIMKAIAESLGKSESQITSGDLANITYLELKGNDVDFKDIGFLNSLKYLDVTSDGNSENLQDLKQLKNLNGVWFENVNMINLNYFKNNINLYGLDMINCGLFSLQGIENLTNLTYVSLGNNYLKDIKGIERLTNLYSLNIDSNQITDLSPLANCTELNSLDISKNKILSLSGIENLRELDSIKADYNGIRDLKPLENTKSITSMSFYYNEIEDLTPIKNLSELMVSGNYVYLNINNNHINTEDTINKYLINVKGWSVNNYGQKPYLYEVNGFDISSNSMNSKNKLSLTFNRQINEDWNIKFYKYDENNNKVDIPYKIVGNKIFVDNKLYNQNKYYLYCNIEYVDDKGITQAIYNGIDITKTGFYTEDINKDNVIDIKDLATVGANYNETATGEIQKWHYEKDLNLDGVIDIYDLVYVSKAM
jgi:Leucine-rich repeat (LRR) protein